MDEITHTILPNAGSGWGGTALGAGFGGLIGSWLGNGFGVSVAIELQVSAMTLVLLMASKVSSIT